MEEFLKTTVGQIIIAVINSKKANKYSIIFLILIFFINNLIDEPNSAHKHREGKQTSAAVIVVNKIAIIKFSSLGKKPEATIVAIVHAFGLTN